MAHADRSITRSEVLESFAAVQALDHQVELCPAPVTSVRAYCPGCEPDADPIAEILDTRWCATHMPSQAGADDASVVADIFLTGSGDAGGEDNRRMCEIFHRPKEA
jgi:hypothetical protein